MKTNMISIFLLLAFNHTFASVITLNENQVCLNENKELCSLKKVSIESVGSKYKITNQEDLELIYFFENRSIEQIRNKLSLEIDAEIIPNSRVQFIDNKDKNEKRVTSYYLVNSKSQVCKSSFKSNNVEDVKLECLSFNKKIVRSEDGLINSERAFELSSQLEKMMGDVNRYNVFGDLKIVNSEIKLKRVKCDDVEYSDKPQIYNVGFVSSESIEKENYSMCSLPVVLKISYEQNSGKIKNEIEHNFALDIFGPYQDKSFKKSAKKYLKNISSDDFNSNNSENN